jgi:hypothetical protein
MKRIHLEKLTVVQLVNQFFVSEKSEISLPCLREVVINLYLRRDKFIPQSCTILL